MRDGKAEKYSFSSPYVYALNNPIKFIDPNGFEVKIAFTDKAHLAALNNMWNSKDGKEFLGKFMKHGASITIGENIYTWKGKDGERVMDILRFQSKDLYDDKYVDSKGTQKTYRKGGILNLHNFGRQDQLSEGFEQIICLDYGMDEVESSITLGHEVFVHADKDTEAIINIFGKIATGGYNNFSEIVTALSDLYKRTPEEDHKSLSQGKVKKFENYSNELAAKKNNSKYKKKYDDEKEYYSK